METICIPKLSNLTKDMSIFLDLKRFLEVTGFVPSSVHTALEQNKPVYKGNVVSRFFSSVRNKVLNSSREGYNIIDDGEYYNTLFSAEETRVIREQKKALLKLINKHDKTLRDLAEIRKTCWLSEAKMKKYDLILSTQKSALKNNSGENDARQKALQEMQQMFEKWVEAHERDHEEFEKKFLTELECRHKVARLEEHLQNEVVARIETSVRNLLSANNQSISAEELARLSVKLYSESCRTYTFPLVKNEACQKEWIQRPKYESRNLTGRKSLRKT